MSNNCHAIGAKNTTALDRRSNDSSCRFSMAHPLFKALKNSSITHRARYQSTTWSIDSMLRHGSLVISIQSTGASPAGGSGSHARTKYKSKFSGTEDG